ncbi:MAG: T9SS type A sorting domain-containing protein [Ignavibacteria bacterium]|nr:T9SS type A sorting domain-containing protein [Ignavibacteria bacterium]
MKRLLSVCAVVLLVCLAFTDAYSQAVDLKVVAMSPGLRSTGSPNFSSPAAGTPNYVSTGLRTVGKGMKVYLKADTVGSGATKVTSYEWTFVSRPTGSTAAFDNAAKDSVTFIPDVTGSYIIQVAVNGAAKTHVDTITASTYKGITTLTESCMCHGANATFLDSYTNWKKSKHATVFARGMTGALENSEETHYKGVYTKSCFKCHTTGWESLTNNGNFGYLANAGAAAVPPTSFDSTWWKGLPLGGSDYLIPYQDSTLWKKLTPQMQAVGNIGCESCHGPAADHISSFDKKKISVTADGGICTQCHESPKSHSIGYFWRESNHATMKTSSGEASNTGCWPCHNGSSFIAWTSAWSAGRKTASADTAKVDRNFKSISCAVCHDPHSNSNEYWLRYTKIDTLANGFKVPTGVGGKGQLCMNCHRGRSNYVNTVKTQFGRFNSRFYPHYSSQADMLFGTQGWEFGLNLKGLTTHTGLKDGCVTCHMSERKVTPTYTKLQSDHNTAMAENGVDKVEACVECHGSITKFSDIKASFDYDMDGVLEGATVEVQGLMDKLKAKLPLDATGEPVTMNTDSMIVKNYATTNKLNYPSLIASLWNYNYVSHDMSLGVHNTKYAVALLRASLGLVTGVEIDPIPIPKTFELSQNYPNPFNPTTEIRFDIPKTSNVKMVVYDIMGRVVKTLVDQKMETGSHRISWNGRDLAGNTVSSGVYFYHISADGFAATKKMTLMK